MVRAGVGHLRRPSPPGPEGARTAYCGKQKTSKSPFGFKYETRNFCPRLTHGYRAPEHVVSRKKLFGSTLKTSAVFLSGFLSPKRKELGGRT